MNILDDIARLGQSIWYDNISRGMLRKGELRTMVAQGVRGVTSNPTIFDKAISGSADYDAQIAEIVRSNPSAGSAQIVRALMAEDIAAACDDLRPVYDRTGGKDGFVSVEVTPSKARQTAATIAEVHELWRMINRPNLMIKIPATKEGLPAITEAISAGVNVNVTLIFSEQRYREVAEAYITGLEQRAAAGKQLEHVASVASVFVSRIDTLVDELLEKSPLDPERRKQLAGRAAVANTKMIYQAYKQIFGSSRFAPLRARGSSPQRPLWGSTGTKNPAYNDLLYVDTIIGPDTVNTVPPATYAAIMDHGTAALTIESDLDGARRVLREVAAAGIDMAAVLLKLENDGVSAFEKSFDSLDGAVRTKAGKVRA
jgi:transaldolase